MWYGVIDGEIWLETKAKSQKAVNLRRNPRASFLIEDGLTYDTLRGGFILRDRRNRRGSRHHLPSRRQRLGAIQRAVHGMT